MYKYAITRKPGKNFAQGITTSDLGIPDYDLIINQHENYVSTLKSLGLHVIELAPLSNFPDAYFVEDTAVVTPEFAVITNPGAKARKGEEDSIEKVLSEYRETFRILAPGTVDGGDILIVGSNVFIGISGRTNIEGAKQLSDILYKGGYISTNIEVSGGLHLKTSVNYIGDDTLLITKKFYSLDIFKNFKKIIVDDSEIYAANSLFINNHIVMPKGFSKTEESLSSLGFPVTELEMSEVQKMDGGLTCMSIRF